MDKKQGWDPTQYQLVDFGKGRKLERFGDVLLDRSCPAAEGQPIRNAQVWLRADAVVDTDGRLVSGNLPDEWVVEYRSIRFQLKLTPFGHVGLFPEQSENWDWFTSSLDSNNALGRPSIDGSQEPDQRYKALNLFGYTGGTTLALAGAGAEVVHVDASAPAVRWARRNADGSGLRDAPIRWIVEDARKFVARELKRGNQYDLVVLDPPTFGRGPNGQKWILEAELFPLLQDCIELLRSDDSRIRAGSALLLTAHCATPDERDVLDWWRQSSARCELQTGRSSLIDASGRKLDAGYFVRATYR